MMMPMNGGRIYIIAGMINVIRILAFSLRLLSSCRFVGRHIQLPVWKHQNHLLRGEHLQLALNKFGFVRFVGALAKFPPAPIVG